MNKKIKDQIKWGNYKWRYVFIILISIVLSVVIYILAKDQVELKIKRHFDWEVETIELEINHGIEGYVHELLELSVAMSDVKDASSENYQQIWSKWTEAVNYNHHFPALIKNNIGYLEYISPLDFNKKTDGGSGCYRTYPNQQDIIYNCFFKEYQIEEDKNLLVAKQGFSALIDMSDLNKTQIIPSAIEIDNYPGVNFILYKSFYSTKDNMIEGIISQSNSFKGIVYGLFNIDVFMDKILSREKRHVTITIHDNNQLIYDENKFDNSFYNSDPLITQDIKVDVAGRKWMVTIATTKDFRKLESSILPGLIIMGSITINILLILLFRSFILVARKARVMADNMSKRLKDKEEYVSAIINYTADAIITIDEHGIIESSNNACKKIIGYSSEEMIGKNIKMIMPEPHHSKHDEYVANYLNTGKKKIMGSTREVQAVHKDGGLVQVELSISEILLNDRRLFSGFIRDITARKKVEIMKDEFVSTVNHELRTPLTAIQGSLGLLKAKLGNEIDKKSKRLIDISYESCEKLAYLINDISDTQKMAAGKLEYNMEETEICYLVEDTINHIQSYAEKYMVTFCLTKEIDSVYCKVDKHRFAQVLNNLLSNAAKFSPKNDKVLVKIAKKDDSFVKVSVTDNGDGISKEFQQKIFQKFAQANSSSTRARGGTGLGLSIAKSIIEAFNGTMDYTTIEGKGSSFFFCLPISSLSKKEND